MRLENQGMSVAGEPKGVVGMKGVGGALAGVTACPEESLAFADEESLSLTGPDPGENIRMAAFTNQTIINVQNTGIDNKASMGTVVGSISNRINEANELSQEKLFVLKCLSRPYPLPSTGKLWCRAKWLSNLSFSCHRLSSHEAS